ncbi:hypothetical protein KY285_034227 [Solanum tuberosum]|nr:hypothetical protein KY285_034227 [Solanum tuberosum]
MGAGLKKDLRVSRVGPGGSLNAFFFLLIGVISQRLARLVRSSMDRTWTVVGVGGSPRVPSSEISGEEDQVGPCEQLDALSPFNPLSEMRQKKRKENPWTDPIISTPVLKTKESGGRGGKPSVPGSPNQSGDLRGGGLPCGGCQRFESAYLQLVNLADTKLYDSTQFFRFGGSIYDLSFMDVDKIHPFPEEKKAKAIPVAKQPECCTLDGESPVAESITSLRSDPSSMGHVESRVNQQGPPCKAKYSWWRSEPTDVEESADELWLGVKCHSNPELAGFSPKCVEAQQLTGHLGGSRSASETMGDKLHRRGKQPDHQLRPLNDRSSDKGGRGAETARSALAPKMNGAKRSAEAVGCKNTSVGERSALERSLRASGGGRSGSEECRLE